MKKNASQLSSSHVTGYIKVENLSKLTSCKLTKVSHPLMEKTLYERDSSASWWKNLGF